MKYWAGSFSPTEKGNELTMGATILFQPFQVKSLKLKNRLVMLPTGTNFATEKGEVTDRLIDYYVKRAQGGVGLVIVEGAMVDPAGRSWHTNLCIYDDDQLPGLRRLTEAVHSCETRIAAQLIHVGRQASARVTGVQPVAPSSISRVVSTVPGSSTREVPKELTVPEIKCIIERYAEAARRAKEVGFDAVELSCGHRNLPEQFLLTDSNKRLDEYGGDIVNRARFMCDIVRRIRQETGKDFIIACRVGATEYPEGDYTSKEIEKVFGMLKDAGTDVFDVTVTVSRNWVNILPMAFPRGALVHVAERVKGFVDRPIICGIRINDPLLAEKILEEKKADLIGMARPLIADPELPRKTLEGRLEDIRMCIACNQGCADKVYARLPITCTVNVEVGKEKELEIKRTKQPKKVLIVGGGPAGMEAARVAALRGHKALLYEKGARLGGRLQLAKLPPHKEEIENLITYLKTQMVKLRVEVHLDTEVDEKLVGNIKPDAVILATGATPIVPAIPGVERDNVVLAEDVLLGRQVGQRVVVIGGGIVGVETAEFLADQGKEVTIIEMLAKIAADLGPIVRMFQKQRLDRANVKILTGMKVEQINQCGVVVEGNGESRIIPADSVVIAAGATPDNRIAGRLERKIPIYLVGDCVEPRNALCAIHEGSLVARDI